MVELFANSGNPFQRPCSAASDLGLHLLPVTHLRVSSLLWVKAYKNLAMCQISSYRTINDTDPDKIFLYAWV